MFLLKKIIFLLLPTLSFSCQTRLEKQGWQRTVIVSKSDISPINKKDKELVVQKLHAKSSYYYWLYPFKKDSTGKIIDAEWEFPNDFNCEIAYYKWESDTMCLVKLLNRGNVRASVRLLFNDPSRGMEILDVSKK